MSGSGCVPSAFRWNTFQPSSRPPAARSLAINYDLTFLARSRLPPAPTRRPPDHDPIATWRNGISPGSYPGASGFDSHRRYPSFLSPSSPPQGHTPTEPGLSPFPDSGHGHYLAGRTARCPGLPLRRTSATSFGFSRCISLPPGRCCCSSAGRFFLPTATETP